MGRVLILNRRYCPGEAWTNRTLAYAKGFAEMGEEVIVYYLIGDKNRTNYTIDIPGIKIVDLWKRDGMLAKANRLLSFVSNLIRFQKEVRSGDKVFLYGAFDYQLFLANRVRKYAKVFCEVTEHPDINGTSRSKFKFVNNNEALKKLDGLFVISQSLKNYYTEIGIDENRVHVINMFVDTDRFKGLQKTSIEKYIAYCGAVSYDKDGVNILIESFAKFYPKHKDYRLYIIGKSVDPVVIDKLKKLAIELGIEKSVVFTGPVPPSEIPRLLYNASVLALARPNNLQAQNGFPTKLGEYLATGNPIVVTRVGEIPLFIKHRENGFLADPNSDSFSEQLTIVAGNYEKAKEIGKRGLDLANSSFSYRTQSKAALDVMNNLDI